MSVSAIDRTLRSRRHGGDPFYCPNQFLVVLDPKTIYWHADANTQGRYPTKVLPRLAHEYWHYLQNLSTIAGVRSYIHVQNIRVLFERTLVSSGTGESAGAASLSDVDRAHLEDLLARMCFIEGDVVPEGVRDDDDKLSISVVGWTSGEELRDTGSPIGVVRLRLAIGEAAEPVEMMLGSRAIEESVAYLVEQQFRTAINGAPDPIPAFPYRLLETLVAHRLGSNATAYVCAALGTLALMDEAPGPALLARIDDYETILATADNEATAIRAVVEQCQPRLEATIIHYLTTELPAIAATVPDDGILKPANVWCEQMAAKALLARRAKPLFDLDVAFPIARRGALDGLVAQFPFCDLLQQRPGSEAPARDWLTSVYEPPAREGDIGFSTLMRALQAQQHYVMSHVDRDGTLGFVPAFVLSKEAARADPPATCPYFCCCPAEHRIANADQCRTEPWRCHEADAGCMYQGGVFATLGLRPE